MRSLSRFLDSTRGRAAVAALASVAHALIGVSAWRGSEIAIVALVFLLFFYTWLAFLNGLGWHRSLKDWRRSLEAWRHTRELGQDMSYLLVEATGSLSTWDRETAEDIMSRAKTIWNLRAKNIEEHMNDR